MLDALQQRGHQELVALDPLQVRAHAEALAGPPEGQRLNPPDVMPSGLQVQAGHRVVHRERQADVHPAQVIDDFHEASEGQLDEMIDVDAGLLLHGLPQAGRAAVGERGVDPLKGRRVSLLAGLARAVCGAGVVGHLDVAGEAEHGHPSPAGGQVHQHHGV